MLALTPRVVDAMWAAVQPQLPERGEPQHPLGCHRPRIADRDVFEAIVFRLVTGCSWDVAGRLGRGGETLHLDRGYAGDPVLKVCESYGIHDVV